MGLSFRKGDFFVWPHFPFTKGRSKEPKAFFGNDSSTSTSAWGYNETEEPKTCFSSLEKEECRNGGGKIKTNMRQQWINNMREEENV